MLQNSNITTFAPCDFFSTNSLHSDINWSATFDADDTGVTTNSSSPSAGDQISSTKFVFDFKTGVLQFVLTADKPTDSQYVYISAYQYVGRTLKDSLNKSGNENSNLTKYVIFS
jgi:hypothetical protein